MSENKKLNEQIAQDFYNNFKGKLEDEQLDQVVQEIKCTENKYHTQGSLICAVFYFRVTVEKTVHRKWRRRWFARRTGFDWRPLYK